MDDIFKNPPLYFIFTTNLDHLHMLKLLGCQIMVKENDENEDSLMLPNAAV